MAPSALKSLLIPVSHALKTTQIWLIFMLYNWEYNTLIAKLDTHGGLNHLRTRE
jgi:hypothetical protein